MNVILLLGAILLLVLVISLIINKNKKNTPNHSSESLTKDIKKDSSTEDYLYWAMMNQSNDMPCTPDIGCDCGCDVDCGTDCDCGGDCGCD